MSSGYSQVLKAETSTETIYYVRGFELISRRTGSEASYYLFDGGMSVRGITDEEGNLTDTLVFDAFGNEVERTGTTENSYGFQGEEQDETGLYYLRARYMDPTTGTFTSMDTYGGNLEDPMSLHKYLFANSNPVKYCDPSGHDCTLLDEMVVCGIVTMMSNATLFWFDYLLHPEKELNERDYLTTLIGGFIAGFFGCAFCLPFAAGLSFCTIIGCILLLSCLFLNSMGLTLKTIGSEMMRNDKGISYYGGWIITVFGDIFCSPFMNIVSFGNDIIILLFGILDTIFGGN